MRNYTITVSYRTHVNSLKRETRSFVIRARSRNAALVKAGWKMREEELYHVYDSLEIVEITQP